MNIVLILLMGILGAVVATVASKVIIAMYIFFQANKRVELVIPWRPFGKALAASAVMVLSLVAQPISFAPSTKLIVFPLAGVCVYTVVLYGAGGISREDVDYIRTTIREI